jgi:hypothetical protein
MPASPIYEAFKRAHCKELHLRIELSLGKSVLSKVKKCLGGEQPLLFAAAYPGEGKEWLGVEAILTREKQSRFSFRIWWYESGAAPPEARGQFKKLVETIGEHFGDREIFVTATLWYPNDEAESLFKPIDLLGQPAIFDSITGFTGVKKNSEGKLVYQLEVSFEPEGVRHVVRFTQTVKLSEDTSMQLCETASKISALALKSKEGK